MKTLLSQHGIFSITLHMDTWHYRRDIIFLCKVVFEFHCFSLHTGHLLVFCWIIFPLPTSACQLFRFPQNSHCPSENALCASAAVHADTWAVLCVALAVGFPDPEPWRPTVRTAQLTSQATQGFYIAALSPYVLLFRTWRNNWLAVYYKLL